MRKVALAYASCVFIVVAFVGITYAVFTDKASVLGASFSTGSAEMKLLADVSKGTEADNLVESLPGPTFTGIGPNWTKDYPIKLYNNAGSPVLVTSKSKYLTTDDPKELRQDISVELFSWEDTNGNGILDTGELGSSFGKKTIVKWNTEGLVLSELPAGDVQGFMLRFSTATVSDTKQGASALFDFEFTSSGL